MNIMNIYHKYHECISHNSLGKVTRNQKHFHKLYPKNDHNGIYDSEISIIDHAETEKSLRQKELRWYHKLKTYAPFGLNKRDTYAAY